jgi:hypothetical protein
MFQVQALSSGRFQRWLDRVNLHRPTEGAGGLGVHREDLIVPDGRGLHSFTFQLNLRRV